MGVNPADFSLFWTESTGAQEYANASGNARYGPVYSIQGMGRQSRCLQDLEALYSLQTEQNSGGRGGFQNARMREPLPVVDSIAFRSRLKSTSEDMFDLNIVETRGACELDQPHDRCLTLAESAEDGSTSHEA